MLWMLWMLWMLPGARRVSSVACAVALSENALLRGARVKVRGGAERRRAGGL